MECGWQVPVPGLSHKEKMAKVCFICDLPMKEGKNVLRKRHFLIDVPDEEEDEEKFGPPEKKNYEDQVLWETLEISTDTPSGTHSFQTVGKGGTLKLCNWMNQRVVNEITFHKTCLLYMTQFSGQNADKTSVGVWVFSSSIQGNDFAQHVPILFSQLIPVSFVIHGLYNMPKMHLMG